MTLIKPRGIVIGKVLNVTGFFIILSVSVLPVLGIVFFLVGVAWRELVISYLYILEFVLLSALVGVFVSSVSKRTFKAIAASYLLLALITLGPSFTIMVLKEIFNVRWVRHFIENIVFVTVPRPLFLFEQMPMNVTLFILKFFYNLLWIGIFYKATTFVLGKSVKPAIVKNVKLIDDAAKLEKRRKKFPYYLIDPLRRKRVLRDGANPMLVKELRWGLFSKSDTLVRAFYISFALFLFTGFFTPIPPIIITLIVAPSFISLAFTKEYELGNLDMLRMTLIRPRQIINGKFIAGIISVLPMFLAYFLTMLVPMLIIDIDMYFITYIKAVLTMGACLYLSLSLGLLVSVMTHKANVSIVVTYLLNAFVYLGIPIFLEILDDFAINISSNTIRHFSPILAFAKRESDVTDYWLGSIVLFAVSGTIIIVIAGVYFGKRKMRDR